jgi:hypothetical protein
VKPKKAKKKEADLEDLFASGLDMGMMKKKKLTGGRARGGGSICARDLLAL